MKKLIVLLIAAIVSVGSMYAQDYDERAKLREERRAEQERIDSLNYEIAKQAINEKKYVLEADRIFFKRGETTYVTPTTNFVSVDNNEATVQLAFNGPYSGPNGLGGITVDGTVTNYKYKENKKGNIFISMNVNGYRHFCTSNYLFIQRKQSGNMLPLLQTSIPTVFHYKESLFREN